MSILKDNCASLGLPEPLKSDTFVGYIIRCLLDGHRMNTRICGYINIGHLNSLIANIRKRLGEDMSKVVKVAKCPHTGEIPPQEVIEIWMTKEQRINHEAKKRAAVKKTTTLD